MNQKNESQNQREENTSMLDDDLQTEKLQQNSAKRDQDEMSPE